MMTCAKVAPLLPPSFTALAKLFMRMSASGLRPKKRPVNTETPNGKKRWGWIGVIADNPINIGRISAV